MALDPVPWFVDQAEHSADVARLLAHVATSGAAGIVGSTDFLVYPAPAPTDEVRVGVGAAIVPNTYEGVIQQAYIVRGVTETVLDVPVTSSAGPRSDMVVLRVDDPQFNGEVVADPLNGPYTSLFLITNVDSTATEPPPTVDFPCIALARIDRPASTAVVEAVHITDLRKVARPNRTRDLYLTSPTAVSNITTTTTADWTPEANRNIVIPEWATQVKINVTITGAKASAALTGGLTAVLGASALQSVLFEFEGAGRQALIVADTLAVTPAMRGTVQTLKLRANRSTGTLSTDTYSTVVYDVEFLEVASAD